VLLFVSKCRIGLEGLIALIQQWIRRRKGRHRIPLIQLVILLMVILSILLFYYNFLWSSVGNQVNKSVKEFYEYEQKGNYGSAWELFHSSMKEKFNKEQYIQQRALIYMQHLGAATFQFKAGKAEKMGTWSMSANSPALHDVYRIPVTQSFLSIFGEISIYQEVFAVEENDSWKLVWSYNEPKD
jgi:hypothetical protein